MQAPGFSTLTITLSDHIAEVCLGPPRQIERR